MSLWQAPSVLRNAYVRSGEPEPTIRKLEAKLSAVDVAGEEETILNLLPVTAN